MLRVSAPWPPARPARAASAARDVGQAGGRPRLRPPGQRQPGSLHHLRTRRKAEVIMALEPHLPGLGHPQERRAADPAAAAGLADESKTMASP